METPLPFEAYVFVTAELLRTPSINQVKFIQISMSPPLCDALGNELPPDVKVQSYAAPTDLGKPIVPMQGPVQASWKIEGQLTKPWMPNFNLLSLHLQELRKGNPIPVGLIITRFNIDTFEYEAVSNTPPLLTPVPKQNAPKGILSN